MSRKEKYNNSKTQGHHPAQSHALARNPEATTAGLSFI
jgi:hypothetical protein